MAKIDLPDLRKQEDAVLLHKGADLRAFLNMYTVPLYFFSGKAEAGKCTGSGSGVLVHLGKQYFLLSAGHCVEDARDGEIVVGITDTPHRFVPMLVVKEFRLERGTERDFGFWEIPAVDAGTIKANNRLFVAASQIEVVMTEECLKRDDWMVVGGYPGALRVGDPQVNPGARLLGYSTILAGSGEAPKSPLGRRHAEIHIADVWVPRSGNIDATAEEPAEIDVPSLSGASGGGCWFAGVRPDPAGWTNARLRLVGTHSGSCDAIEIAGENHVFSREILLGHHLNLIASYYRDLRAELFGRWPQIKEFPI